MSSKADLARIGREGFGILEARLEKTARPNPQKPSVIQEPNRVCHYQYQPKQVRVYQVKPDEIMNCYEVLQFHEGLMVKDFTTTDKGADQSKKSCFPYNLAKVRATSVGNDNNNI
ncbi:Uncharacterized protein Fot_54979 [Forsythia ovata]|uniref:Uncharacterized protein n=1 Tax=Forsythia ovata TaxID=205694 RepID=A0ABD1P5Y4_9LAMI